ncbi:MAG: hypothetical protein V3U92_19110 [Cellulophaga sp.]
MKSNYKLSKTNTVLLKSIQYFKVKSVSIVPNKSIVSELIHKEFPLLNSTTEPFDIVFIDELNSITLHKYFKKKEPTNNSCIFLINAIHKNKKSATYWESIVNQNTVTVTIDMFYCGIVSFRNEQVKEHFKIRI